MANQQCKLVFCLKKLQAAVESALGEAEKGVYRDRDAATLAELADNQADTLNAAGIDLSSVPRVIGDDDD